MNPLECHSTGKTIRLILIDDHPIMCDGLHALLNAAAQHIEVVGKANSGADALVLANALCPDVMLVDISMGQAMNGIQLSEELYKQHPEIRILILSAHNNKGVFDKTQKAGARGYILKGSPIHEIIAGIEVVMRGGYFVDKALQKADTIYPLTKREYEVLLLLIEGYSNYIIGQQLGIQECAVETHRFNIRKKLGVDKPMGMRNYAEKRGWIYSIENEQF